MVRRHHMMPGRPARVCRLGLGAAAVALAAVVAGCSRGPTEQQLRAPLVAQVREDIERYNQRMDRYGGVKWEIDGSSCSLTRSRRELAAKPSQIQIRSTGGRTTVYDAEVPETIRTYIKSGLTEPECLEAVERALEPQQVTVHYEWDSVTRTWHQARTGDVSDLLGAGQ